MPAFFFAPLLRGGSVFFMDMLLRFGGSARGCPFFLFGRGRLAFGGGFHVGDDVVFIIG